MQTNTSPIKSPLKMEDQLTATPLKITDTNMVTEEDVEELKEVTHRVDTVEEQDEEDSSPKN
jgi:hypothetical protein